MADLLFRRYLAGFMVEKSSFFDIPYFQLLLFIVQ